MRVRSAKAGEGRYFVKVSSGMINVSDEELWDMIDYSDEEVEDMLFECVWMVLSNNEEEKEKTRELAANARTALAAEIEVVGLYDVNEM